MALSAQIPLQSICTCRWVSEGVNLYRWRQVTFPNVTLALCPLETQASPRTAPSPQSTAGVLPATFSPPLFQEMLREQFSQETCQVLQMYSLEWPLAWLESEEIPSSAL